MMKKVLFIFALTLVLIPSLVADNAMNIRFGFLSPSGAETGIFPGISYGINVDNVVEVSVGFDYFYKNYSETRDVNFYTTPGETEVTTRRAGSDITTYYIPVMGTVKISVPMENFPVVPYGGMGLGWGLLWEDVFVAASDTPGDEHDKIDEVNFYNGFNWGVQLGAKYPLSQNAAFYGEAFFNGGKMKKDVEKDEYGITWDEINMSGMGLRLGVELRLR